MKQIFFSLLLIMPQIIFGQNEVHLKSGEILDCKVKSLANGDLTVLFKGNIVHLKIQDIANITFSTVDTKSPPKIDTSNATQTKAPIVIEPAKPIEQTEVKGVVTYYFNDNFGDKPDVGAEVLIYKPVNNEKYLTVFHNLKLAEIYWSVLRNVQSRKVEKEYIDKLNAINAYPEDKFQDLKSKVYKIQLDVKYRQTTITTTVDGNGNYSVKVPEGEYNIIFVSNHHDGECNEGYVSASPNKVSTASTEFR